MQNPTPSNKSKQGLSCANCMKTTHTKDRCYYLIGFRTCEYCNVKDHTKRRCPYLNSIADWARNQMRTNVRTTRKPNQKRFSMLGEVSGSNSASPSPPQSKEVSEGNDDSAALDIILPDELLAKIFSFLPVTSIIKATTVCKRWYDAICSRKYNSWIGTRAQKPWFCILDFCMSTSYSYDPVSQIWYKLPCPSILLHKTNIKSSSHGLLCLVDSAKYRVIIHNPITKETKQLPELECEGLNKYYTTMSLSVDQRSPHSYTVAVVKVDYDVTIQIYESQSKMWISHARENLQGWDGCYECMICDKVLYYLIRWNDMDNPRVGLIMHDLSTSSEASTSLMSTLTLLPTCLRWARLINMNDRVIVVGGYHRDPFGIEKMGIWELHKRSVWEEIERVPDEFVRRFSEIPFLQNYRCCGAEGLIYIHRSRSSHDLLTFDMVTKQWGWVTRFPMHKNSVNCSYYYGFCFEPRPDVLP